MCFSIALCETPKAAGISPLDVFLPPPQKLVPVLPDSNTEATRQVVVPLPSGVLYAHISWAVDEVTSADVLRGYIEYRPDADQSASCSDIRFIQVAKAERNGGVDYDWPGLEAHRNLLRTSRSADGEFEGGYFVDHKASACTPGLPCSPYFRDYWPNARESEDGAQRNGHAVSASLVDYPFGWDVLEQISLESCARCIDTGQFLGCAAWSARWPTIGSRQIAPIRVQPSPSKEFLAALARFEEFYGRSASAHYHGPRLSRILKAITAMR